MYCEKTQSRMLPEEWVNGREARVRVARDRKVFFSVLYSPIYHSIKKEKEDSFDWLTKYKISQ